MAPIYLNPLPSSSSPFPLTKDDHHDLDLDHDHFHLFMINSPATHDPRQTHFTDLGHDHDHHNKVKEPISKQDLELQAQTNHHDHSNGHEPARWVSSKVRLVHKMISPSSSSSGDDHKSSISMMKIKQEDRTPQQQHSTTHNANHFAKNKNSTVIRVCSDCSTTSTPLWRSGPRGPKSLCNACGIRQRKARRAMAEAQNGAVSSHEPAAPVARAHNKSQIKEKKPRTGPAGTIKKQQCKPLPAITGHPSTSNNVNDDSNQFFKDLALRLRNSSTLQRVFPRDEEEAAFLLMELSCGLVHT